MVENFDPKTAKIKDYMSKDLKFANVNDNVFGLMDKFLGRRMRHMLIEKEGVLLGIVSSGDVIRATVDEKDTELKKLNQIVGWEYYENWKWKD